MRRFEYKVVSFPSGAYTASLNEYGREGWELVGVAPDVHDTPPARERGRSLPIPGALGKIEDAASKWGAANEEDGEPAPGSTVTTLLWVLRRPLDDDY